MSLKIAWLSNAPWAKSGYANQTALFVPRLVKAGHDIAIHAFYGCEGSILNWDGVQVYPKYAHPYGQDIVGLHAQHANADIILTLIDAWVMEPQNYGGIPWVAWAPIDSEPIPRVVADKLKQAIPIAYSKFGVEQMREAGLSPHYVPHGVATDVMKPTPMADARAVLGWPMDRFIVGMVAANVGSPSRKAFPEQLLAFAKFKAKHPDALLWLHTTATSVFQGPDIHNLCEDSGLKREDYQISDQYQYAVGGFDTSFMATMYSAFDVLMSASYGEGFGIPILEAQACGTPVIVGDWTAMSELCFAGWKVDRKDAHPAYQHLRAWMFAPNPDAVLACLEHAYTHSRDPELRATARDKALAYDADTVTERYWLPVLAEIEQRIKAPVKVAGALG